MVAMHPNIELVRRFHEAQRQGDAFVLMELLADDVVYPSWPTVWGTLWAHREACMLAALQALDAALDGPNVTKQGLRRRMVAALAAIAERGPEAVWYP